MISQQQAKDLGAQEVRRASMRVPGRPCASQGARAIVPTRPRPPDPTSQLPRARPSPRRHTPPARPTRPLPPALQVTTDHVLLGLVAEDSEGKHGYLDSGLTHERVRAAVESLTGRRKAITGADNIPFSREVRKTFEAATNVSDAGAGGRRAACCLCQGVGGGVEGRCVDSSIREPAPLKTLYIILATPIHTHTPTGVQAQRRDVHQP